MIRKFACYNGLHGICEACHKQIKEVADHWEWVRRNGYAMTVCKECALTRAFIGEEE